MCTDSQKLFNYLHRRDALPEQIDLVIGFGHFDPAIPKQCARLYKQLGAKAILFTGGIGAGTADLNQPEADYFREICRENDPDIPDRAFFIENRSTNTGKNLLFSMELLTYEMQLSPLIHRNSLLGYSL